MSVAQDDDSDEPPARAKGLVFMDRAAYASIPLAAAPLMGDLPGSADLSADFPKPGSQGNQGSCVAWAVAYALKSFQEKQERSWSLGSRDHLFSPSCLYNRLKKGKQCDGGTTFDKALRLLHETGVCSLEDFAYSDAECQRQPEPSKLRAAREFKIAGFRTVNIQDDTEVRAQLASGFPVLIGMMVDAAFERLGAGQVYNSLGGGKRGGHAMVIVGYKDSRSAYKVMNSWGTSWGDKGFGWITYDSARALIKEAYIVQDATGGSPPKPPKPDEPDDPDDDNPPEPGPSPEAPAAEATAPMIAHNVMINSAVGPANGMAITLGGRISGARGRKATIVVRFTYPNNQPLRANPQEPLFRDVFGNAAVVGSYDITGDPVDLSGIRAVIPYYAVSPSETNRARSGEMTGGIAIVSPGCPGAEVVDVLERDSWWV